MNTDVDVVVVGAGPTGWRPSPGPTASGKFLLAGGPGTLPADADAGYADRVDTAEVNRPTGIVALIRPDAYIAWAQGAHGSAPDGDRTPPIRAALTRWCGSPSRPAHV